MYSVEINLIEDFALTYLNDVIKVMEVETQQDVNLTKQNNSCYYTNKGG